MEQIVSMPTPMQWKETYIYLTYQRHGKGNRVTTHDAPSTTYPLPRFPAPLIKFHAKSPNLLLNTLLTYS